MYATGSGCLNKGKLETNVLYFSILNAFQSLASWLILGLEQTMSIITSKLRLCTKLKV